MPSSPLVVVIGDINADVVTRLHETRQLGSDTASSITWRCGGGGAAVARGLARQGVATRLIGCLGDDLVSRGLRAELAALDLADHVRVVAGRSSGTVVALIDREERHMLTDRAANLDLTPADVEAAWPERAAHLHLSGYTLLSARTRPAAEHALALARRDGVPISIDPASVAPLTAIGPEAALALLPRPVLLTPNLDEARLLSGADEVELAARVLADEVGEVVVSAGARGLVHSDGRSVTRRPAPSISGPVNPLGAGDALVSGLLAARVRGLALDDQLDLAIRTATSAVGGEGFEPSPNR